VPTQLGTVLVQGYYRIDADLVLPLVRSSIEKQCDLIAKGQAHKADVLALSLASFQQKYNYFVKNIHRMDALFEASFSPLTAGGKPWSKCGLSNRYLQLIVARPQRLYNKNTEQVYNLPQGGSFKLWAGLVCPVEGCGFELSLFQVGVGKDQRTYPLCPNCYNSPRPVILLPSLLPSLFPLWLCPCHSPPTPAHTQTRSRLDECRSGGPRPASRASVSSARTLMHTPSSASSRSAPTMRLVASLFLIQAAPLTIGASAGLAQRGGGLRVTTVLLCVATRY
jgi:hypothetical protein